MRKRLLATLLTVCMVITLLPAMSIPALAANPPATSVTINDVSLNSMYPYLVSGANSASGTLGTGGCTAYFDATTGTLTLQGYTGKGIAAGAGAVRDPLLI